MYVCIRCECLVLKKVGRGCESPGTKGTGSCELPGVWVQGIELRSLKSNSCSQLLIILSGPVLIFNETDRISSHFLHIRFLLSVYSEKRSGNRGLPLFMCGAVHSTVNFQPLLLIRAELPAETSTTFYRNPKRPMIFFSSWLFMENIDQILKE